MDWPPLFPAKLRDRFERLLEHEQAAISEARLLSPADRSDIEMEYVIWRCAAALHSLFLPDLCDLAREGFYSYAEVEEWERVMLEQFIQDTLNEEGYDWEDQPLHVTLEEITQKRTSIWNRQRKRELLALKEWFASARQKRKVENKVIGEEPPLVRLEYTGDRVQRCSPNFILIPDVPKIVGAAGFTKLSKSRKAGRLLRTALLHGELKIVEIPPVQDSEFPLATPPSENVELAPADPGGSIAPQQQPPAEAAERAMNPIETAVEPLSAATVPATNSNGDRELPAGTSTQSSKKRTRRGRQSAGLKPEDEKAWNLYQQSGMLVGAWKTVYKDRHPGTTNPDPKDVKRYGDRISKAIKRHMRDKINSVAQK
jgi:hypothetical protein